MWDVGGKWLGFTIYQQAFFPKRHVVQITALLKFS